MLFYLAQFGAGASVSIWPLAVLAISVVFIVAAISVMRLHAFVALILAAFLVGWLTKPETLHTAAQENGVYEPGKPEPGHAVAAVILAAKGFGKTAEGIGIVIALAAIIGMCLMDSGAADVIVRRFMKFFGEKRAGIALLCSGFFLSIPVFFDTVFFLLAPIARALGLRTGKNYLFYVLAICGGGAITHSIVPPTPGPLLVGERLDLDLGATIIAGILAGLIPATVALLVAKRIDARMPVPVRETPGASISQLQELSDREDGELPAFGIAVLPVVLPVALLAIASFLALGQTRFPGIVDAFGGPENFERIYRVFEILGNKVIALFLGAAVAMWIYLRQTKLTLHDLGEQLKAPLETAGLIILITSAGGAFGAMIRHAAVGDTIQALGENRSLNYVLLAWLVTAVVRVAQGSATVAMITGVGLMAAIIGDGSSLPYHPVYIFLAIGFGSIILSWMNDSGFWIVGKLTGLTEQETLKSWTIVLTVISVVGLIQTLVFATILPFK